MPRAANDDVGTGDVRLHGISKGLATRQDRSPKENRHVDLAVDRASHVSTTGNAGSGKTIVRADLGVTA